MPTPAQTEQMQTETQDPLNIYIFMVSSWHAPDTLLTRAWHAPDTLLTRSWHAPSWHSPDTLLTRSWHAPDTLLTRSWHSPDTLMFSMCSCFKVVLSTCAVLFNSFYCWNKACNVSLFDMMLKYTWKQFRTDQPSANYTTFFSSIASDVSQTSIWMNTSCIPMIWKNPK